MMFQSYLMEISEERYRGRPRRVSRRSSTDPQETVKSPYKERNAYYRKFARHSGRYD